MHKEDKHMANNLKRCFTSYVIREMQIKTMMRYQYTSIRMPKVWNTDNISAADVMEQQELSFTDGKPFGG